MNQIKLLFCLFFLNACVFGNFSLEQNSVFNLPSVGESTESSRSSYFFFDFNEANYRNEIVPYYEISTTDEFGDGERAGSRSNCEILLVLDDEEEGGTSEPSETLICILDMLEGDILIKDIHLTYNFPEGMCTYVSTGLPWHFNYEILPGPVVREQECGEGEEDCGFENIDPRRLNFMPRQAETEEALCPARGLNNVRCCSTGAMLSGDQWEPDMECFGGPALIATGDVVSDQFFYRSRIAELQEGGLREEFTLPSVLSISGYPSTVSHTNYHSDLDLSLDDLENLRRDTLPLFLQRSPYYPRNPRLFFEFDCLDSGAESLHKILVMIREWNTLEEFLDFFEDGGNDSADPDVEGEEGEECEYENRTVLLDEEGGTCNDFTDMDDIERRGGYPGVRYQEVTESGGNN